jgi:hypothetical protein
MITCDDVEGLIPFVVDRTFVDLGRLKVSTDRREPESTPIYFKSRFMAIDDPKREQQLAIEIQMLESGLFESGAREPDWSTVKPILGKLIESASGF